MVTWQQLEQLVKDTIRLLKGRKRESAAFAIAVLCFSGGLWLDEKRFPDFGKPLGWKEILQIGLYAVGAISFVYGVIRVWRLVPSSDSKETKNIPLEIKGLEAFTEADGELFRKLGRENELRNLLGLVLNEQVLMVVVRGASGAGKTSLLRAGLKHILKNNPDSKDVQFHYWEAVPTEPDKGLLRAIQEKWPEGAGRPVSLEELVNPADALGRQSHVIVLDQFEQLRGSRKIFQLLRRIVRESKPPHRITWVIAFRREFSADWMDFVSPEQERGFRPPQDVSLRLFTPEQAREVIGQLVNESNLKDSIEQSVINNLVEAATVEGEVSPVDIGIGLLVLAELHERQSGNTITIRDYQFAGGAEGLLTQYISRCLDLFPKESQDAILKAMLALRDPETNQRLAEGLTVDELATESGTEARLLKTQLDRLSHRDTRLLETVTPTDGSPTRYRLPHERLIPALYRLTGKLLAEVDQAKLKFQNAFQAWKTNDKRSNYLLKAKGLRLVERYKTQIPWGNDEQEKKSFLHRSKRRDTLIQGVVGVIVFGLIWIFWEPLTRFPRSEANRYLDERAYYLSLSALQSQLKNLKRLELTESPDLGRFTCLSSPSLEELSLQIAPSSNSLAGLISLSKCSSLKKLRLDLRDSQVSNLEPLLKLSELTHLTLNLYGSRVSDLEPLVEMSNLKQLTLDLRNSQVSNLEPLSRLRNWTQLALAFHGNQTSDLKPLSKLSNLTQLTLNLNGSQASNLEPLSKLSNLTSLMVDFRNSQVRNLEPLSSLGALTRLTLDLNDSQVSDLEPLSRLINLKHLTLNLLHSRVSNLEPLAKLSGLTHLMLYLSHVRESDLELLSKLNNLTQLALDLDGNQISHLEPLSKLSNLTQLRFDDIGSQVNDLESLSKLSTLKDLTLYFFRSRVSNLLPLSKLSNLTRLRLNLSESQVRNLEPLSKLSNLTQLTLELGDEILEACDVSDLDPLSRINNLTHLTLNLHGSRVSKLEPLSKLDNLTQLTLSVYGSGVSNFEPLSKLTRLQSLSIESATRAQRMSLRKIPASLVELKF